MSALLTIFLWVLIAVLVAVLALLFTPINLQVHFATSPRLSYRVDLRAFGGLAPRVTLADSARKHVVKPVNSRTHSLDKRKIPLERLPNSVPRMIRDIFRHVHLSSLKVECEFGMEDPADTGQIAGLALPIAYAAPVGTHVIDLRPNFDGPCLEAEITAAIHFTAAAFFLPVVRFVWRVFGPVR